VSERIPEEEWENEFHSSKKKKNLSKVLH